MVAGVDLGQWQHIIEQVVASGGNIIRPWFTKLEPIALEHGLLEIQTPGEAEQDYCRLHATGLFTEAAQAATGRLVGVCFLTRGQIANVDDDVEPSGGFSRTPASQQHSEADREYADSGSVLNRDYVFSSFVTGPCNRLAHAACRGVSDNPGTSYNPLFLHGSVGLGKTHLLQATCQQIAQQKHNTKICLLSCETFVNHFIDAVEQGRLRDFRYRYRYADVLAVDDIQFLADHEQTQE
ncbi:MAG: ATP-binding protein, partial [Planctomycetes bacterium]|nr:ATP-binding protein [Planctomycetota bacterium]